MRACASCSRRSSTSRSERAPSVLPGSYERVPALLFLSFDRELVGGDVVEELAKLVDDLLLVHLFALELDRGLLDHALVGEDRGLGANGERDRVGRPGVDLDL